MKSLIVLSAMFIAHIANAQECQNVSCKDVPKEKRECVLKEDCAPKLRKLKSELAEANKKIEQLKAENDELKLARDKSLFVVHTETVEDNTKKNSVSLLGAESQTALKISQSGNNYTAKTAYEGDVGLMYQRDFDRVRASIGLTVNGTGLLGVGFNF